MRAPITTTIGNYQLPTLRICRVQRCEQKRVRYYLTERKVGGLIVGQHRQYDQHDCKYNINATATTSTTTIDPIDTSPKRHQNITNTSPEHHQHITRTSPEHHQHITITSPKHHHNVTNTSPTHNQGPRHHQHITKTSPTLHQYITKTSPTHHQHVTNTSPTHQERTTHITTKFPSITKRSQTFPKGCPSLST